VALWKRSTEAFVDIFGRIGEDPGSAWTDSGITTLDKTLVRKAGVTGGVTSNPATNFPTLATEWDQYDTNNQDDLGSHTFSGGALPSFVDGYENRQVSGATSVAVTGLVEDVRPTTSGCGRRAPGLAPA
jgi:hypothetical protein